MLQPLWIDVKLGGYINYGAPQTNHWSDWPQIWWANSLQALSSVIDFWPCSAEFLPFSGLMLVEQFLYSCTKDADRIMWIELKNSWANSLWAYPRLIKFGHAPLNSHHFLAPDWSSSFQAFADKPLIGFSKFGRPTHDIWTSPSLIMF